MSLDTFSNLVKDVMAQLPPGISTLKGDIEQVVQHVIKQKLSEHELVTQEAFNAQKKVLTRTREKIDVLADVVEQLRIEVEDKRDAE